MITSVTSSGKKHWLAAAVVFILLVAFSACKKKDNRPATTMTAIVNGDTIWTTTNVYTSNQGNGTVYIKGTSPSGNDNVALAVTGFIKGKKPYYIDYRGSGSNITGNTGRYTTNSNLYEGSSGTIYITDVSNNTITGYYYFSAGSYNISGTFIAAEQ